MPLIQTFGNTGSGVVTKLKNPRKISLTGNAFGSTNFDGSQDVTIDTKISVVQSPVASSTMGDLSSFKGTIQLNDFQISDTFSGNQTATDWELSTDPDFTNIVNSSYNDTTNLTSWDISNLDLTGSTPYYVRSRFISGSYKSLWSIPIQFTTPAKSPVINGVTWSSSVLYELNTYIVIIDANDPDGNSLNYSVSCTDNNVTIVQDSQNLNHFSITFPDYTADTTMTFTYTVDNGVMSVNQTENKLVKNTVSKQITLSNNYGSDYTFSITSDGTYLYQVGASANSVYNESIISKIDKELKVQVNHRVQSKSPSQFRSVVSDETYVYAVGNYDRYQYPSSNHDYDYVLVKFDKNLNINKRVAINIGNTDYFYSITTDGTYLYVTGSIDGSGSLIIKFDKNLNIAKQISINSGNTSYLYSITTDETYVYSVGYVNNSINVVKLDKDLNIIKQIIINADSYKVLNTICSDENYLYVAGSTGPDNNNNDFYIVKLDKNLNIIKQITIPIKDRAVVSSISTDGINLYIAGSVFNVAASEYFGYIAKLDKNLNIIKMLSVGDGKGVKFASVIVDGRYVYIGGAAHTFCNTYDNGYDHYLAKLELDRFSGTSQFATGCTSYESNLWTFSVKSATPVIRNWTTSILSLTTTVLSLTPAPVSATIYVDSTSACETTLV